MILVGDEPYYRRFGFSRATARRLDYPPPTNPDRLLARELVPGAFEGVVGMVRRWTRTNGRVNAGRRQWFTAKRSDAQGMHNPCTTRMLRKTVGIELLNSGAGIA